MYIQTTKLSSESKFIRGIKKGFKIGVNEKQQNYRLLKDDFLYVWMYMKNCVQIDFQWFFSFIVWFYVNFNVFGLLDQF